MTALTCDQMQWDATVGLGDMAKNMITIIFSVLIDIDIEGYSIKVTNEGDT